MRCVAVAIGLLAAGCGGHADVRVATSGAPATGVSTGASVNVQGGSTLGAVIAIGVLGATVYGESYNNGVRYRANPFVAIQPAIPAPQLDPSRRVLEQDCTRPIEDWSANLKCR